MTSLQDQRSFGWGSNPQTPLATPQLEYYRKNRWVLDFAGLPTAIKNLGVILRINAKSAARPSVNFEETKIDRINGTIYLAGKPQYQTLEVVFYDAIKLKNLTPAPTDIPDFSVSDVIEQWRELIHQPARGDAFGAAANYKGWAYLHYLEPVNLVPGSETGGPGGAADEIDPGSSGAISQTWFYQGMFPLDVKYGDGDYSSSDVQEVSVTFRYDRAYRTTTQSAIIS